VLTLETQTLARACGKSHVHNLEPEDLVALTIETSLMTGVRSPGCSGVSSTRSPSASPHVSAATGR